LDKTIQDSNIFNKSASQFKTTTLDITNLTQISTAKHILASITHTRNALEEAIVMYMRKQLELKQKLVLDDDASKIDVIELKQNISNLENNMHGAIRKVGFLLTNYNMILASLGVDKITEEMYEKDEARNHIMTAFMQALTAARSRNGVIDEGNHIYLFQLGINGAMAQKEVFELLDAEEEALKEGFAPTHEGVLEWLNRLADKYAKHPITYIRSRKLIAMDENLFRLTDGDKI
jgi:hypothetical protein